MSASAASMRISRASKYPFLGWPGVTHGRPAAPYTELAYFGPIFKLLSRWIMPVPMPNSIGYVLFPRRSKRDSIKRSARVLDYWPFCEQSTGLMWITRVAVNSPKIDVQQERPILS